MTDSATPVANDTMQRALTDNEVRVLGVLGLVAGELTCDAENIAQVLRIDVNDALAALESLRALGYVERAS